MNLLDYIIIIVMIYLIIKGVLRGLIREVASLLGIILGIWLANLFQPHMSAFLKSYLPFDSYMPLLSFAVIFMAVLILCNLIGWALKLLFKKLFLGWVDKTLGIWFAIVKGIIIIYLVIVILTFFIPAQTPLIADSKLAPWIIKSYQTMVGLISPDHYKRWKEKLVGEKRKVEEIVSDKIKGAVKDE